MLNSSRLYYKTICMKNILHFIQSYKVTPAVASHKEQLYEQTASNPAFTKRNMQKANAYLLDSSGAKTFGRVTHSTELVSKCLACPHFDINSADWISDDLHVISS